MSTHAESQLALIDEEGTAMTTITLHGTDHPITNSTWTNLVASFSEFCEGARAAQDIEACYRNHSKMPAQDLATPDSSCADIYCAALLGRPV